MAKMSKDSVLIIDYGSGNIRSAAKAFEKVIDDQGLDYDVVVSSAATDVERASHIVLPGQGAFGDCISNLRGVDGMIDALENAVLENKKPFLGICVGMQLLADKGFEGGEFDGLGWIEGSVKALNPDDESLKIPHMGWNELILENHAHPIFSGVETGDHYYFVHSYFFDVQKPSELLAEFEYGGRAAAIIGRDNIIGVQFHPEKSHDNGLKLLSNFLKLR